MIYDTPEYKRLVISLFFFTDVFDRYQVVSVIIDKRDLPALNALPVFNASKRKHLVADASWLSNRVKIRRDILQAASWDAQNYEYRRLLHRHRSSST